MDKIVCPQENAMFFYGTNGKSRTCRRKPARGNKKNRNIALIKNYTIYDNFFNHLIVTKAY